MSIGRRELRDLSAAIAGTVPKARTSTVTAGTVTAAGGETWVLLDGAEVPTPVQATTCAVAQGDRVSVRIQDGTATVTGNVTQPAQTASGVAAAVAPVAGRVGEVEGQVGEIAADVATVRKLVADSATIGDLEATNAKVTNLEATKASVKDLEAESARITELDAAKANIDLANVNNAWIANGTIKDASISDAQILGVSANKLTAGTIDAAKIKVTNLNADNITVGTINGKLIGNESIDLDKLSQEVPTKEQLDKAKEELQGQIDGNIETFTVSVVPTLNNEPAKTWTDDAARKKHVGDVAYVVNKASAQDGYAYRFGYDEPGKAYGWVLIKDNDVTAALKRISEAEGSIDGLKSFETSTSKWIDETDEGLTQVRNRTTTLETQMGDKVSTTTFKELSDTVDEQSSTITTMSDTLSKKADGSTVTSLSQTVNQVKQTAEGNSTRLSSLSKTVEGKADSSAVTTVSNKLNTLEQTVDGTVESIGSLTETVSKKADSSTVSTLTDTVNTVKKTADSNASSISSLSKTVDTKADGSAVTTLANRVTTAEQSLDGFKSTVSTTYETKADATSKKTALETSFKQTNDAVALKASKTDLDAATKRISAAETSIKANADSISLKASKTEVPGLVSVGGRNLYVGSKDYQTGLWLNLGYWVNDGAYEGLVVKSKTGTWAGLSQILHANKGDILTFSAWAKVESGGDIAFINYTAESNDRTGQKYISGIDHPLSYRWVTSSEDGTEWRRVHAVIEMTEDRTLSWRVENSIPGKKLSVCGLKLEKGNVPTAWTPAPEDVQSDISTAKQAAIDVSAEAIKSFVKSAGGETSYKQTDSGFTWTTTSPMTKVADSTARTNASNAVTAASNAATAASNAKTAAEKAQTTANSASSAANAAQSKADTAKSTADSASTAASKAQTAADAAAKTATDFLTYASGKLTLARKDSNGNTTGTMTVLGSDSLELVDEDGTPVAHFGELIRLGRKGNMTRGVEIDDSGIKGLKYYYIATANKDGTANVVHDDTTVLYRINDDGALFRVKGNGYVQMGQLNYGGVAMPALAAQNNVLLTTAISGDLANSTTLALTKTSASMQYADTDYGIGIVRQDDGSVDGSVNVDRLYIGSSELDPGDDMLTLTNDDGIHFKNSTGSEFSASVATGGECGLYMQKSKGTTAEHWIVSNDGTTTYLGCKNGKFKPYYTKGDYLTLTDMALAGFVTNSSKSLCFSVHLPKPLVGVSTVTVTSTSGFQVRQNEKYLYGSSSSAYAKPSSYSASNQNNIIRVYANFGNSTNVTNNDSAGIQWSGKITFS